MKEYCGFLGFNNKFKRKINLQEEILGSEIGKLSKKCAYKSTTLMLFYWMFSLCLFFGISCYFKKDLTDLIIVLASKHIWN